MTWHDDDSFWDHIAQRIFPAQRHEAADAEVDHIVKLLDLAPGARVLDLPCGVGVHSVVLARRGFQVTAVDRTAAYLDAGRAAGKGLDIDWRQGDMRTFARPSAFDAVLNLFTSFGYFEDPQDERRVLATFRAALKPGGRLLMDLAGREVVCRIFRERDWQTLDDGALFLEERRITRDWSWIENRWIVVRDGRQHELRFGHRLYGAADLAGLVHEAGFEDVRCFGSLDGTPYDDKAQRLVLRAVRGG